MFGIHDFGLFLISGILLNLVPGPDTFYILGRSLAQGRAAGVASVLGISSGALVHTMAAALGLSALLAASASAFNALKLAGALYLIYLGGRMLFSALPPPPGPRTFASCRFAAIYRQGLMTNLLNPKVGLFFLAFMPQFINADSPNRCAGFIVLGLCFAGTGTLWCLCLAWFASLLGNRLRKSPTLSTLLNRAAGALFILLGVRLAATR
jgi:threonine/homoserine/homoserine lactone efflux protein